MSGAFSRCSCVVIAESMSDRTPTEVELIKHGAEVENEINPGVTTHVIVLRSAGATDGARAQKKAQAYGIPTVSCAWIQASVVYGQAADVEGYQWLPLPPSPKKKGAKRKKLKQPPAEAGKLAAMMAAAASVRRRQRRRDGETAPAYQSDDDDFGPEEGAKPARMGTVLAIKDVPPAPEQVPSEDAKTPAPRGSEQKTPCVEKSDESAAPAPVAAPLKSKARRLNTAEGFDEFAAAAVLASLPPARTQYGRDPFSFREDEDQMKMTSLGQLESGVAAGVSAFRKHKRMALFIDDDQSPRKVAGPRCPNDHKLMQYEFNDASYIASCDQCGAVQAKGASMHGCRECNHDICAACADAASEAEAAALQAAKKRKMPVTYKSLEQMYIEEDVFEFV